LKKTQKAHTIHYELHDLEPPVDVADGDASLEEVGEEELVVVGPRVVGETHKVGVLGDKKPVAKVLHGGGALEHHLVLSAVGTTRGPIPVCAALVADLLRHQVVGLVKEYPLLHLRLLPALKVVEHKTPNGVGRLLRLLLLADGLDVADMLAVIEVPVFADLALEHATGVGMTVLGLLATLSANLHLNGMSLHVWLNSIYFYALELFPSRVLRFRTLSKHDFCLVLVS